MASCDKISEDNRYIEAEMPETGRKVLVEEFTGQFCINCPDGHEMIRNIKSLYGDNVVAVSIHAGQLAFDDETFGLKTADGDKYANMWGVQAYPSIVVDRQGGVVDNMPQWQNAVMKQMGQNASVDMELNATLNDDKTAITVDSKMLSNTSITGKYQVWVVESGIKTLQQMPGSSVYNMEYTHDHVYRAAVNGVGGEDITLTSGIYSNNSCTIDINHKWNLENIEIVAFIYNSTGVIQVEETTLK